MTGLCVFVGSTPVQWMSRRQGAVETSACGAKFCTLRTAAKKAIAIQCMLRSLGVKSPKGKPTLVFGDDLRSTQSLTNLEALLNKKHTVLSFHKVRESHEAHIVQPHHCPGAENQLDVFTKIVPAEPFLCHVLDMMHRVWVGQQQQRVGPQSLGQGAVRVMQSPNTQGINSVLVRCSTKRRSAHM